MNEKMRKHLEELYKTPEDREQEALDDEAFHEELLANYVENVRPMTEEEYLFGMDNPK